uniref:uncharacterized protein n=1 Tax=Pristiophorus japonicus TaxID=55135 RepID=UPI00398EDE25
MMRSMQRRTGGGPPVPSDITDMEERVLALVGKHPRTATDTSADPEVMPHDSASSAAPGKTTEARRWGQESADDPTTYGAEELRLSPVNPLGLFSTDESADFEEPASPRSRIHSAPGPSIGPPVIRTSTLEVPAPSISPQGTPFVPRTAPTLPRSRGRSRSVPRTRHDSGEMVQLSRRTVDIGDQLIEALRGHIPTPGHHGRVHSAHGGGPGCDSQEHCWHSPPSGPRAQHSTTRFHTTTANDR